jgi:hypothetical protein
MSSHFLDSMVGRAFAVHSGRWRALINLMAMPVDETLMRACSTLFLFRSLAAAVASSEDEHQAARIENQLLRLFADIAGADIAGADIAGADIAGAEIAGTGITEGDIGGGEAEGLPGFILLGKGEAELCALAHERGHDARLVERACREGAVDGAAPLYVHGAIAGVIAVDLPGQVLEPAG